MDEVAHEDKVWGYLLEVWCWSMSSQFIDVKEVHTYSRIGRDRGVLGGDGVRLATNDLRTDVIDPKLYNDNLRLYRSCLTREEWTIPHVRNEDKTKGLDVP